MVFLYKKKIILFLIALCTLFSVNAAPRGKQELILSGSFIYDALTAIAMESGRTDFTDQTPLTIAEILMYMEEIDYDSLSDAGKKSYDSVVNYINAKNWSFDSGLISIGIAPEVYLEGYYKTNGDIDWVYDRYSRNPFLYIPATVSVGDYISMATELTFGDSQLAMLKNDNYVNIPTSFNEFDINFPDWGYISTGISLPENTGLNFQLGMGTQDIGRSLTGSVIMSSYFTGASYGKLEFYSPNFRYNMDVIEFNVDKYMYLHQMDFRPFKKLQFSVMEGTLVDAPLELRFLNPWIIYHGMADWWSYGIDYDTDTCAYFCFKASYTPVKYLRLYALYAQDQIQVPSEQTETDTTPNAMGFQLGVESYIPFRNGYFHTWLEGYYADPFLYIKYQPNSSLVRTYYEALYDANTAFYEWVGSPFGPDTIACEFNFGYEVPEKWSVTFSYLFKASGEYCSGTNAFKGVSWGGRNLASYPSNWVYPNSSTQSDAKERQHWLTPTGTPEYLNRIALKGEYSFTDYFSIACQPAFIFIFNNNNVEGDFDMGVEFALVVSFKPCILLKR